MNPTINYRSLRRKNSLKIVSGAAVEVLHEAEWTLQNEKQKARHVIVAVTGSVEERGNQYQVKWRFNLTAENITELETALGVFGTQVEGQSFKEAPLEYEISAEIFPWLIAGFLWTKESLNGYYEFRKDGQSVRTVLEDLPHMKNLRDLVRY